MIYLYAGLGVAMLSGIMAIFEMGLALTGNSLLASSPETYLTREETKLDEETRDQLKNERKSEDQVLLGLLSNPALVPPRERDAGLCQALKSAYESSLAVGAVPPPWRWTMDSQRMPVLQGHWEDSCLMNDGSFHRVVVRPPAHSSASNDYEFYSCVMDGSDRCSFEYED